MRSSQRIRQTLRKYQRKPVTQQGILGNEVGEIAVPNRTDYVYVRVAGLGTISIYNKRVPLILDLPVDVGYDPLEPKNFQVLNIHRYPQGGGRGLVDVATILHGKTHNWAGIDPVYIEKRQLMPLRPTPLGGMQVYVTREVTYYDDKAVAVTGQQLDLSSYVPATGSLMVLIYKDTDELIKIRTGSVLKDLTSLSLSDAPPVYPGTVPIALIRLYGGQSGIAEGYQDTDLIDVRQLFSPIITGSAGGAGGGHVIQDEGVSRTQRTNLNFKGSLVWAVDNAGADSTDIIISGTSSGISTGTTFNHDHSGDAGDGGRFLLTNLLSTGATVGQFAKADGTGGITWENITGVYSKVRRTITPYGFTNADPPNPVGWRSGAITSVTLNGETWEVFAYYDINGKVCICKRIIGDSWAVYTTALAFYPGGDSHNYISVGLDPNGYIHISWGLHDSALWYRRSTVPINLFSSPSQLTANLSMLGTNESHVSYPTFFNDPAGSLYFMFRDTPGAYIDTIYFYKYDHAATTWAAATGTSTAGLLVNGAIDSKRVYHLAPIFDDDFGTTGKLHFVWTFASTPPAAYDYFYYMAWDGTNWTKIDGSAQTIPARVGNATSMDTLDGTTHQPTILSNAVYSDSDGHPHAVIYETAGDNVYHLYHIWHDGANWVKLELTDAPTTATYGIMSVIAIDRSTDTVTILYTDNAEPNSYIYRLTSDPGDYTTWTKTTFYDQETDLTNGIVYGPKYDVNEWERSRRLVVPIETWASTGDRPIYVLDFIQSGSPLFSLWDAAADPNLHANDIDTATGIHHTLGTGTYQSAAGDHTHPGSGIVTGAHTIMDEGSTLPYQPVLNFIGNSVWATNNAGQGRTDVIISGTSSGGGHIIEDEGSPLTQRSKLNFVGASVAVTDDAGNDRTIVTVSNITGSSSGDVSQYGAITAGHVAIFHADKSIEDGGVLSTGTSGGGIPVDGWVSAAGTWSYSSADDPTYIASVNADMTTTIAVGMRIKLTQATGGTKYFIVTVVGAFAGGATLITMYGGTDYNLEDEAVSDPYYSPVKAPFGFPLDPSKWKVRLADTAPRTQASPSANVWYNLGTLSISIPIGIWNVSYSVAIEGYKASAVQQYVEVALSTANNSASDADLVAYLLTANLTDAIVNVGRFKTLVIASKTPYYLNCMTPTASITGIYFEGGISTTIIEAVCAYL